MLSGNSNWSHRYQGPVAVVQPHLLVFRFAPGAWVLVSWGTIAMQAASGAPGGIRCAVFPSCRLVIVSAIESADPWAPDLERYRADEWRYCIFRDMILADARRLRPKPTILDIGCGAGFDGDVPLQRSIADVAGCDIGVEADPEILLANYFAARPSRNHGVSAENSAHLTSAISRVCRLDGLLFMLGHYPRICAGREEIER